MYEQLKPVVKGKRHNMKPSLQGISVLSGLGNPFMMQLAFKFYLYSTDTKTASDPH